MNKKINQKSSCSWMFLILGLVFMLSPNNALAIEHDLAMTGIVADKLPMGCVILISVQSLVVGTDDYGIESGDVSIQILYSKDGSAWSPDGYIEVTRAEMDYPFIQNKVWPRDFDSEPNNKYLFHPPCNGEYRFKAKIIYPEDQNPENSERETPSSISINCAGECPPDLDFTCCELVFEEEEEEFYVVGLGIEDEMEMAMALAKLCERYPELCPGVGLRNIAPEISHFKGDVEILFDNHINHFKLALTTLSGEIISKMVPLRKPIKIKGVEYNQQLKFFKSKDVVYRLMYWPTKETKVSKKIPFPILVRPLKLKHK